MKIVICGSMSAAKEMCDVARELRRFGHRVTLPAFIDGHARARDALAGANESLREKVEHDLIRGYFEVIRAADSVLVVNAPKGGVSGYVGGNTFLEMGFAFVLRKPVYLLWEAPFVAYRDEILAMSPVILNGDLSVLASG